MLKKLFKSYEKLIDEKLENGTIMVLLIALLIVLVSIFINDNKSIANFSKSNILENNNIVQNNDILDYITIEGVKYKINLQKIN